MIRAERCRKRTSDAAKDIQWCFKIGLWAPGRCYATNAMGKSQKPLQHAQSDAQHPPFARSVTSKLVETLADHGATTEAETQTTLTEVRAAAVMTAVVGIAVAGISIGIPNS